MGKEMTCKVCGYTFRLDRCKHYTAADPHGVAQSIGGGVVLYDAFDCPSCGCQNIAGERKDYFKPKEEADD